VRTWIVLSVLWLLVMGNNNMPGVNLSDWRTIAWIFVAPPLGLAVILAAIGWILSGFRRDASE
jgi:hypothetical protein